MRILILLLVLTNSCVHTYVDRISHKHILIGKEGYVKIYDNLPNNSYVVFDIYIQADLINTEERRLKHLLRRASLLGCNGITSISVNDTYTKGICFIYEKY